MYKNVEENIRKAHVEVLEVLRHISAEAYYKIPKSIIDEMNENKNIYYKFKLEDVNNISRDAACILIDLYITYIADAKKKSIVMDIMKLNGKSRHKRN